MIGAVFTCFLSRLGTGGYPKAVQKMVSGKMDIAGEQNTWPNATRPDALGNRAIVVGISGNLCPAGRLCRGSLGHGLHALGGGGGLAEGLVGIVGHGREKILCHLCALA